MEGLLMAESLAQRAKTRCVVFICGEGGLAAGLWIRELRKSLPDEKFEKVFRSLGSRVDRHLMRLADIVMFGNASRENFGGRSLIDFGMALALEKPIFVYSKFNGTRTEEGDQLIQYGSTSLGEVLAEIEKEGEKIIARKKRAARNT